MSADEVAAVLGEKPKIKNPGAEQHLESGDVATLLLLFQKKLGRQASEVFASLGTEDYVEAFRRFVEGLAAAQHRRVTVHIIPEELATGFN